MLKHKGSLVAYKSWRWNGTDWYTGKFKAVLRKKLTAPDWQPDLAADHCGNGFHCAPSPADCLRFTYLGRIAEVRVPPPFQVGDKIRSKHLVVTRWLSDAEIAAATKAYFNYDYSEIIPRLRTICKNPLSAQKVTKKQVCDLEQWASVWASVRASVGASVKESVWASVGASVRASVKESVWASVGESVRASVRASVGESVWASVWASVRASVGASVGYIFRPLVPAWKLSYPFQSAVDLWLSGCVPSFDGTTWRLHGKGSKVIYTIRAAGESR